MGKKEESLLWCASGSAPVGNGEQRGKFAAMCIRIRTDPQETSYIRTKKLFTVEATGVSNVLLSRSCASEHFICYWFPNQVALLDGVALFKHHWRQQQQQQPPFPSFTQKWWTSDGLDHQTLKRQVVRYKLVHCSSPTNIIWNLGTHSPFNSMIPGTTNPLMKQ